MSSGKLEDSGGWAVWIFCLRQRYHLVKVFAMAVGWQLVFLSGFLNEG